MPGGVNLPHCCAGPTPEWTSGNTDPPICQDPVVGSPSMTKRTPWVAAAAIVVLCLAGCGSGSSAPSSTTSTSAPTTSTSPSSSTTATTAVVSGTATCPTLAQAEAALGASYSGPMSTPTQGGGIVCEYTGSAGNAAVAIFAHQSTTVFAGQVAHAPGAPVMPALSGVGNGAYGQTAGGRSVVNAYSNGSRTLVAAQAPGPIAPVEALARVALSDN